MLYHIICRFIQWRGYKVQLYRSQLVEWVNLLTVYPLQRNIVKISRFLKNKQRSGVLTSHRTHDVTSEVEAVNLKRQITFPSFLPSKKGKNSTEDNVLQNHSLSDFTSVVVRIVQKVTELVLTDSSRKPLNFQPSLSDAEP